MSSNPRTDADILRDGPEEPTGVISPETITAAYRAEDHTRPVTDPHEVPPSFASITREWVTAVLCRDVDGAEVLSFELGPRDDGSSNRRRVHIEYNEAGQAAGLPATVFGKANESLKNRIVLGVSHCAKAEADFYGMVRNRIELETPRARYAAFDPKSFAYMVLMDDLGDRVRFPSEETPLTRSHAEAMVRTLAQLHSRFYQSDELGTNALPYKRWPDWWRRMMAGDPNFADYCDRGFEASEPVLPPRLFARRSEVWPATEKSVARHDELPHTLIHSDVHLRNWYITADDRLGLTDWHLTTIGHWSRDFAFATTTALTVDQRRDWQEDLLRLYLELMAERGVPTVDFDEALLNVRQQLMTALAFWTITIRPTPDMPDMQPADTTWEFLRRLGAAIDDHDSLDAF